jgi:predicted RNase H-like HicB family nuclease
LRFSIEIEQEKDGRWIAEIPEVPGAIAYGPTEHDATVKAYAIALRAVADSVEHSKEDPPASIQLVRAIA